MISLSICSCMILVRTNEITVRRIASARTAQGLELRMKHGTMYEKIWCAKSIRTILFLFLFF